MTDEQQDEGGTQPEVYRSGGEGPIWYSEEPDHFSVVQIFNILLRHRWKVVGLPLAVAAIAVAAIALWPASYTSTASIMPQAQGSVSGQLSQLSGVASQFGINVPGGTPGQSPRFYADLLTSSRLLEEAVTFEYTYHPGEPSVEGTEASLDSSVSGGGTRVAARPRNSRTATLVELYGLEDAPRAESVVAAAAKLREAVSVETSAATGVVSLSVTTPWPEVSTQVADRLIDLVNRFNNRVRQSQASEEAEFVAERLEDTRQELRAAEDSLQAFLQRNVRWQQSPELGFQHDRMQREVNLKQQVYTSLATRYEEARISEVKSTPVVTIVTEPRTPVSPNSPNLVLVVLLSLTLGGVLGLLWAFGAEFVEYLRQEETEEYREFVSLRRDAAEEVRSTVHQLRRLVGEGSNG